MGVFEHFPYTNFHELNAEWLMKSVKELLGITSEHSEWIAKHEVEYQQLKDLYDQIIAGNFTPEMIEAFNKWMSENALDLVGALVKQVFFGITDDGYFVAYIPESWDDITFGTSGLDIYPLGVEYGRLTLSY